MIALAMVFALAQPGTHLAIEPWTGSDFQTTSAGAAKYRLKVNGKPNSTLRLRAQGVAQGGSPLSVRRDSVRRSDSTWHCHRRVRRSFSSSSFVSPAARPSRVARRSRTQAARR
jgi:hypothetical protein